MRTRATVLRKDGATAWLKVCHGEHCVGCGMHSPDDTHIEVQAHDSIGVSPGQLVELHSDAGRTIRMLFLVFWMPLLAASGLAFLGHRLASWLGVASGWGAVPLGIVGLLLAVAVVLRIEKRTAAGAGLQIACIISDGEAWSCHGEGQADGNSPRPGPSSD